MKRRFKLAATTAALFVFSLCAIPTACSPAEEALFATEHPRGAPATQSLERAQAKLDPIAAKARQAAAVVQGAADGAAGLGVPGASAVAAAAAMIGTLLGVYNERRTRSAPLRSAFEQVVQSIEAAFPDKSDKQKAALASVQDQATKALVSQVKTT